MPALKIADLTDGRLLAFDLEEVLDALQPLDPMAEWIVDNTELTLRDDDNLHLTDAQLELLNGLDGQVLSTSDLRWVAASISQTIWGTFTAFRVGAPDALLCIKAIDSSFWLVWSSEANALAAVRQRFTDVTDYDDPRLRHEPRPKQESDQQPGRRLPWPDMDDDDEGPPAVATVLLLTRKGSATTPAFGARRAPLDGAQFWDRFVPVRQSKRCETVGMEADEAEVDRLQGAFDRRDATYIGQAYAAATRRRLDQIAAWEADGRSYQLPGEGLVGDWLGVVWDGEDRRTGRPIDATLWLDLVVAAADALANDAAVWCVGDGPADHLVGEHHEVAALLHAARSSHPGVEAMFQAMLEDYRSMGYPDAGWWSDPSALSR